MDITASDTPVTLRVGGKDFTMDSTGDVTILTVGVGNWYLAPIIQIDRLKVIAREVVHHATGLWAYVLIRGADETEVTA